MRFKIQNGDENEMKQEEKREWVFAISFAMAFVTHCSLFFGGAMSVNEDNFTVYKEGVANATLGRWVCDVLYKIGIPGAYRAQSWIGFFVLPALAAVCVIVLRLIKIENKISMLLTIAVLVSFPTLAYSYGYLYDSVMYTFSLLFAALAVYVTNRRKYGWILGAVCLMLSLGLYQAWISFAVTFTIVYIIIEIKNNNLENRQLTRLILQNLGMGIGGLICYLASVKIYNMLYHIELASYKGLNSMGSISLSGLPVLVLNCYKAFARFLKGGFYYMPNGIKVLNGILTLLMFFTCLYVFVRKIKAKRYLEAVILGVLTLALPIGMCLMDLVSGSSDNLSVYGVCLVYVLIIKYTDDWIKSKESLPVKGGGFFIKVIHFMTICVIFCFLFITQIYYYKLHVFYQRTFALANRVAMRIEEMEEYPEIRKVVIGGTPKLRQDYGASEVMFDDVILNDRGLWGQFVGLSAPVSSDYSLSKFIRFMNGFLGTNYESAGLDEAKEIMQTNQYSDMPLWPDKQSIQVINDTLTIKMEEWCWINYKTTGNEYEFNLNDGHENVFFVWQLFKDGIEIANYEGERYTYNVSLEEPGTYFAKVFIKDAHTKSNIALVVSDNIVIK